jgi:phage-related minor tail protein
MAVKAGTAFVDFEGDFSELNKQVSSHFDKIAKGASERGKKAGAALGKGMAAGIGVAGVAAGALFMKGVNDAIDAQKTNAKLAAQLGTTKATSKKLGKVAGKVYADAYGESLGEVNEAVKGLIQNTVTTRKAGSKEIEGLTKKTLDLASAFDQDVAGATRGVGKLMRTGLVKDANQAFDVVTKGFQKGGDQAEDLLDTLNEYSTQWRKLGVNAETATGLIVQGLRAGARDSDLVADALKEFSIRALDGSKTTSDGFKQLGIDADNMAKKIGGGGSGAAKGLDDVLDRLRKIKDPVKQAQVATELFGTQAEDLGDALFALDPSKAVDALGKTQGAAKKLGDTLNDNVAGSFESLKRKTFQEFQGVAAKYVLPEFDKILKIVNDPNLTTSDKLDKIGDRFADAIEAAQPAIKSAVAALSPIISQAFETIAPVAANAFISGFLAAPAWAKFLVSAWLITKLGGTARLLAAGTAAGTSVGAGVAAGTATSVGAGVAAGGGIRAALMRVGTLGGPIGIALAAGAAVAFSTELRQQMLSKDPIKVENLKFDLPKNLVEPIGGLIGPLGDLERAVTRISFDKLGYDRGKLLAFGDAAEETFKKLAKAKDARGMGELANDARKLAREFPDAASELTRFADAVDDAARRSVGAFRDIASMGGRKLRDIKTVAANTGQDIKQSLGQDTKAGKEALAKNFAGAAEAIQKSMDAGVISTATGTKQIEEYMVLALQNMGFTKEQAIMLRKGQDPYTGKAIGGKQNLTNKQRGGWINMGAASGDSVHAMLERDEYVLNRKAVRKIGRTALDRLNFGDAPRFQKGGSVTGDTDFLPALLNALKALSADVGQSIYVQSGRRTVAEQLAQGPSTPSHPVAGPNGPHVRGVAADITPGQPVFGRAAGKFGLGFTVMPQEPWHIQLLDAAKAAGANVASAVAVTAPKIQQLAAVGPNSPLRNLVQSVVDTSHAGAQALVNNAATLASSMVPGVGEAVPSGGTASGNGADLMREISKGRGWNFNDWWALDAGESSHGTNLANPTSTARLRGQFLDSNWGKYGPGSDPRQNPSMSQQIQSMAAYIAERYGNPTNAYHQWLGRSPHWYQRGGLMSFLAPGGKPSDKGKKGAKVKSPTIDSILHGKSHKAKEHLSDKTVRSLAKTGATDLSATMARFESESTKYADWAARASEITDTDALQKALNAEMTARGGRSGMTQPELDRLFPAGEQDAFIQSWLRGNATFNGGIQTDWLTQQLNQLLGWRNSLIDNPPIFKQLIAAAVEAYNKLKKEIKRIEDDIAALTKKRDKAIEVQDANHTALVDAKKELSDELKKKKPDKKRVARLTEHVEKYRAQEAEARQDRSNYNAQLTMLRGNRSLAQQGTQTLGGDDGAPGDPGDGGRIGDLNQAVTDMASNLIDVHGVGSTMARFVSPSDFQLGTLGGTILNVQNSILGITRNAARATAEEPAAETPGPSEAETRSKEILAELLKQANLRTAVSQAQYDVFSNAPFGGIFHQGGTVPGPIGAPRMILAQGGEVVLSNDAVSNGPAVSVNFANGMGWLRDFVDVRVDNQTRAQGRRSERQLPGQGSRR